MHCSDSCAQSDSCAGASLMNAAPCLTHPCDDNRCARFGARARETSSRLVDSVSDGIKKLATGDPLLVRVDWTVLLCESLLLNLQLLVRPHNPPPNLPLQPSTHPLNSNHPPKAICKAEPSMPQLVLACCSSLVSGSGVRTPGIFQTAAPADEVERLSAAVGEFGCQRLLVGCGCARWSCAVLCRAVLCCAVLCCAVLLWMIFVPGHHLHQRSRPPSLPARTTRSGRPAHPPPPQHQPPRHRSAAAALPQGPP